MVGSVLVERMRAEGVFQAFEPVFFSTSQAGGPAPDVGQEAARHSTLRGANAVKALAGMDRRVSCLGGDYTTDMHTKLRAAGYNGLGIDAASTLRMKDNACIILDPVNRQQIDRDLERGVKDFVGGNCTVSLMLMAMGTLIERGWV